MRKITSMLEEQGRRNFLKSFGTSMAGLSLSGIFSGHQVFGAAPAISLINPMAPKPQDFAVKAKACIFLYMYGGPSQMDLFDYIYALLHTEKYTGTYFELIKTAYALRKKKDLGREIFLLNKVSKCLLQIN